MPKSPDLRAVQLLLTACCLAAAPSLWAQTTPSASQQPVEPKDAAPAPAFDVASIKPHQGDSNSASTQATSDGFRFINMTVEWLVRQAYDLSMDNQIEALPGWAKSEHYDFEMKLDADTVAAWKDLSHKQRWKQVEPLLQSLLADRCKLKAHLITREMPVYDLVIAKSGLKMKEAAPDEPIAGSSMSSSMRGTKATMHAQSVDTIVGAIGDSGGRLVVDKTGLAGKKFDYELTYADDRRAADATSEPWPSIFAALEEQLGLKLVPDKCPVNVLAIDSIERPSSN